MDARTFLTRGVVTGLRLGRGTADRVKTLAGPALGRLTGTARGQTVRRPEPPTTTTFTPSKRPAETPPAVPTPASVAHSIAPKRPSVAPVRSPRPKPRSAPGAKLPPPRPS